MWMLDLETKFARGLIVAAFSAGCIALWSAWLFYHDSKVILTHDATIIQSNIKAVGIGAGSARKSADDSVRGKLDPSTRYSGPAR